MADTSFKATLRQLWRLLWLIRPYWTGLARGILVGAVATLLGLVPPLLTRLLVDAVYPARDTTLLVVVVLGVVAVMCGASLIGTIRSYYSQLVTSRLSNALSLLFFNHVQHLPVSFFDQHQVGEVVSRFGDVRSSLSTLTRVFETVLISGIYLLIVPPILFWMDWRLAMLSLLTTPLTSSLSVLSSRVLRRYWKESAEAQAQLNAVFVESLSHVRTLKLAGAERRQFAHAKAISERATGLQLYAGGVSQLVGFVNGVVKAAGTALCTWYGWTLILGGNLTLGEYLAFAAYLGFLTSPVAQITSLFADLQRSAIALSRMFEYLDLPTEVNAETAYEQEPLQRLSLAGELEVRRLTFEYPSGRVALRDISLRLNAGAVLAVVGPSGAGKSSLVRLLAGLDLPNSGDVLVDGRSLRICPVREMRREFAVVWQEPGILHCTIRENLTLGLVGVDDAILNDAIRVCRLESLIAELPSGLDTHVHEWGSSLSAGQRQRLALARALVRSPRIMLLDEATSNVDMQTEAEILQELLRSELSSTVVFVSHRLNNVALADFVAFIRDGELVGFGPHPELLASNSAYRQFFDASAVQSDAPPPRLGRPLRFAPHLG